MRPKALSKTTVNRESKDYLSYHEKSKSVKIRVDCSSYFQSIIDSFEDELMVIDKDYRIIEANKTVLVKHDKKRQEIIGQYCYGVSHGRKDICRPPYHECPIQAVWETGKPARTTHLHVYHTGGKKQERYVDIIASPIRDSNGNITAISELIRDVTEMKEMELRLTEAYRELSALNAIASIVSRSLDLDEILTSALEKTLELMNRSTGGILLWDEEKQMLCYRVYHGLPSKHVQCLCYRLGEGMVGKAAQTGKTAQVEDISKQPAAVHPCLVEAEGLRAFASVPLRVKNKVLGVLNIASRDAGKFLSKDLRLLNNIATQIAIAVENAKLHQAVQHKDKIRGELLSEVFRVQEEERRRIARELHDETSQILSGLSANLEAAMGTLPAGASKSKAILKKTRALSINILDELHKLIYELRPTLLDDLGLVAAIGWLVDNNLQGAGIVSDFKTTGRAKRLEPKLEAILFRVIQEAVYNIARHANARSANVSLHFQKDAIAICVKDNGTGFDVAGAINSKDRPRGLGLLGMVERVDLVNGSLNIKSQPGGGGTEINIKIPLN